MTCLCGVDVGEYVKADEIVARVETDKVVVDILSQHDGVITKYFAEEGDTVEVGGQLLEIDTDAKAPAADATPAPPKQEAPAAAPVSLTSMNACLKYYLSIHTNILLTTFIQNSSSQPLLPRQQRLPSPPQPRHRPQRPPQLQASKPPAPRRPRRRRQRSRERAWRPASK